MLAFIPSFSKKPQLSGVRGIETGAHPSGRRRSGFYQRRAGVGARTLRSESDDPSELFERISLDKPRRLFRVTAEPETTSNGMSALSPSPTQQQNGDAVVLSNEPDALQKSDAELRETIERLGLTEAIFGNTSQTDKQDKNAVPQQVSFEEISAIKCFYTALLAWCFSWLMWNVMGYLIVKFEALGPVSDWYVVQRLTVVFRALVVASFAMGSGLSFFTGAGLVLLGGRVLYSRSQRTGPTSETRPDSRSESDAL